MRDVAVAADAAAAGRAVFAQIVFVGEAAVDGNRAVVLGVAVQILMAGAAVGVVHKAPGGGLEGPAVERDGFA